MKIRRYRADDCKIISELFYETVHNVNNRDYTETQLSAWAANKDCLINRIDILTKQKTLIAETENRIVGFGSIDKDGYLDLLFVDKDWQNKGIATLLCDELEQSFDIIKTHSSITAKRFFEKRGYKVIQEQEVQRFGISLKRYEMCKFK